MDHIAIVEDKLDISSITNLVTAPSCGAISSFVGKFVLQFLTVDSMVVYCCENVLCKMQFIPYFQTVPLIKHWKKSQH